MRTKFPKKLGSRTQLGRRLQPQGNVTMPEARLFLKQAASIVLEADIKRPRPMTQDPCAGHPSHHAGRSRQCPGNPQTQKNASCYTKLPQAVLSSGWTTPYEEQRHAFFPGFGLIALISYIFHPQRRTTVLLLQHNYFDFVFFNKSTFLLGNSSIQYTCSI